jgi:hypothetical protein
MDQIDVKSVQDLHALTDDLNVAFQDFEQQLRKFNPGVRAEVGLSGGWKLCWTKCERWGLFAQGDADEFMPICNASRNVRVQAASLLPGLVQAINVVVQDERARVVAAAEQVRQLQALLKG